MWIVRFLVERQFFQNRLVELLSFVKRLPESLFPQDQSPFVRVKAPILCLSLTSILIVKLEERGFSLEKLAATLTKLDDHLPVVGACATVRNKLASMIKKRDSKIMIDYKYFIGKSKLNHRSASHPRWDGAFQICLGDSYWRRQSAIFHFWKPPLNVCCTLQCWVV